MSFVPQGYRPVLDLYQTQQAIELIKVQFADRLSENLHLKRVSAPLFVLPETGLNDTLSGVERPVRFDIPDCGRDAEVVQSLAKWKRYALHRYGFRAGKGLYTDMNAIRRDEVLDNLHSVYVDQWDWERRITEAERSVDYLLRVVDQIVMAIVGTQAALKGRYEGLPPLIDPEVSVVTAEELLQMWPDLTPEAREHRYVEAHPTTFVLGIGGHMSDGSRHGSRAADYDDWALNGDLILWNDVLGQPVELSSMGIRVNPESLKRQLSDLGQLDRISMPYHRAVLEGTLQQTIGGGIGQSRLCLQLMGKAHIGEVQSAVWDDHTVQLFEAYGITLL